VRRLADVAGEQSFLFQLYNKLSAESQACPGNCGHAFKRTQKDFFAVLVSCTPLHRLDWAKLTCQPDFKSYLAHVAAHVRPTCPKCKTIVCLACGEKCAAPVKKPVFKTAIANGAAKEGKQADDKGKGKKPENGDAKAEQDTTVEVDELLHCVDLQVCWHVNFPTGI
jgi:hypothetical protein